MIGGYVSVTPLEDEEAGLLADLVAARLATEVTVTAWRRRALPGQRRVRRERRAGGPRLPRCHRGDGDRRCRAAVPRGLPWASLPQGLRPVPCWSAGGGRCPGRRCSTPSPVHLVRGEGVWLFDPDDRRYLDCYNNVPVVGHSHPRVVRAVARAAAAAGDPQPLSARGDRRARGTAQGHPAARAGRRPGRELRQRGQRPRLADRPRGHRAGGRGGDRLRLPRADRGHARPVPGGVGQGRAARPCRHHPRARRVPRSLPAGGGRLGASGTPPTSTTPPGRSAATASPRSTWTRPSPPTASWSPRPPTWREAARRARALGGVLIADEVQAGHGRYGTGPVELPAVGDRARHGGDGQADGQRLPGRRPGGPVPAAGGGARGGRAVQHVRRQPGRLRGRARRPGRHRGRGPGGQRRRRPAPTCARAWRRWPGATRSSGTSGARACCSASSWSMRSACPRRGAPAR